MLLRSLKIDPTNVEAAGLLSEHRKPKADTLSRGKKTALAAAALALTVTAWFGIANPPGHSANGNGEAIKRLTQSGEAIRLMARNWVWGSGGNWYWKRMKQPRILNGREKEGVLFIPTDQYSWRPQRARFG